MRMVAGLVLALLQAGATTAHTQSPPLARADSAWHANQRDLARRLYTVVVQEDPSNSQAVFRLATLTTDRDSALALYRRYTALEADDEWGWMALGDHLAGMGRLGAAIAAYRLAVDISPGERDAQAGLAGLLSRGGQREAAIVVLSSWLRQHPTDGVLWGELGREQLRAGRPRTAVAAFTASAAHAADPRSRGTAESRLRLARRLSGPAVEPLVAGSTDSDQFRTFSGGVAGDVMVSDGARLGARVRRGVARSPDGDADADDAAMTLAWRPRSTTRVDLLAGAARLDGRVGGDISTKPIGEFRIRWRAPGGSPAVELRGQHAPLAATPEQIANQVIRSEARLGLEVPAGRWRLRGIGRGASLDASGVGNTRVAVDGVLARQLTPSAEISAQYHVMGFADPTTLGFFAPRRSEIAELATYFEIGGAEPVLLAVDLGGGAQRTEQHGELPNSWALSLRGYAYLTWTLAPGRELRLEAEAYNAPGLATAAAPDVGAWRYFSVGAGVRVGW